MIIQRRDPADQPRGNLAPKFRILTLGANELVLVLEYVLQADEHFVMCICTCKRLRYTLIGSMRLINKSHLPNLGLFLSKCRLLEKIDLGHEWLPGVKVLQWLTSDHVPYLKIIMLSWCRVRPLSLFWLTMPPHFLENLPLGMTKMCFTGLTFPDVHFDVFLSFPVSPTPVRHRLSS